MKKMYSYMCGTAVMAELVNMMRVVNAHLRLSLSFSLSLSLSLSLTLYYYYYIYLVENNMMYQIII